MKIKPFKLSLLAAVLALIVMIAWFFVPIIFFVVMNPLECDEGPDKDHAFANVRGDRVMEYFRACTGFGTFVDNSIVLQLHGDENLTKIVAYGELRDGYPKFRWVDDDTLNVDLGPVHSFWGEVNLPLFHSVWAEVDKVGSIHITYTYFKIEQDVHSVM